MRKKIICREREERLLEQMLVSGEAEFLALYGRRRVGKTFLIEQFFADKSLVFFQVMGAKKAPSILKI